MENIALYGGEKTKTTPYGTGKRFGKEELTLLEEALEDPEFPEGEMYIMGEYCTDMLGQRNGNDLRCRESFNAAAPGIFVFFHMNAAAEGICQNQSPHNGLLRSSFYITLNIAVIS